MVKMLERISDNLHFGNPTSNEPLVGIERVRRSRNTAAVDRTLPS